MSRRNWAAAPMAIVVGTTGMGAADAQETSLPTIEISAQRATAPFRTRESTSATRSEADVMEIPFAVSSVDTKLIQTVAATRGDDLYDWVAGVSRQNNFGGLWDNYAVRGFAGDGNTSGTDYLVNGFSWNRGMSVPRDTVNLERMEVLRGRPPRCMAAAIRAGSSAIRRSSRSSLARTPSACRPAATAHCARPSIRPAPSRNRSHTASSR